MNRYVIFNIYNEARNFITNENQLKIKFVNIVSCSAIIFICKYGYEGFHYGAQSLVCNIDENKTINDNKCRNEYVNEQRKRSDKILKYRTEMNAMINHIEQKIGKILEIYCYTPQIDTQLVDAYKIDVEEDKIALSDYFCKYTHNFMEVTKICDLYSIKNKNIPWIPLTPN